MSTFGQRPINQNHLKPSPVDYFSGSPLICGIKNNTWRKVMGWAVYSFLLNKLKVKVTSIHFMVIWRIKAKKVIYFTDIIETS